MKEKAEFSECMLFDCDDCGELTEEIYSGRDGGLYCEDCIYILGYEGND